MTRYGARKPTKAQHRAGLVTLLTHRTKPFGPGEIDGIARSFGVSAAEVEKLAGECRARRA